MKYPFQAVPNFSNPFGFLKAFDFKRSPLTAADLGSTEVERAFLINFPKYFLNKVFIRIKIAKNFKFYAGMVISGSTSIKKCQKMLKKATIWTYTKFF